VFLFLTVKLTLLTSVETAVETVPSIADYDSRVYLAHTARIPRYDTYSLTASV